MKNPIIVALDVDDPARAWDLVKKVQPFVGGFKVGPRLTLRTDKKFLKDLSQAGILFFDHKFFDIPSTTAASVEVAAELGATWVTVHGLSGPSCLADLARLEGKIRAHRPEFRVLAVTVLTSFTLETLPPIWRQETLADSVLSLAGSALAQGLSSFVCSPEEITALKQAHEKSFLVVPGIRPAGSGEDDQKRVATPERAMAMGASALVIGRPIVADPDPASSARRIFESLK